MNQAKNIGKLIFPKMLRILVEENGWTQERIAAVAGVAQASVNGWFKGSIPRADALYRLSTAVNISMEELLTGSPQADRTNLPARHFDKQELLALAKESKRIAGELEVRLKNF